MGRTVAGRRKRLEELEAESKKDEEGTEETMKRRKKKEGTVETRKKRRKKKEETVKMRDDEGRKRLKFVAEGGKETLRKAGEETGRMLRTDVKGTEERSGKETVEMRRRRDV